ncbi:MAG: sensor histidine kinase [Lachnospiraceae bacterium]|nr:sensor histidine kinase [Lachnospiraceae bacterium]
MRPPFLFCIWCVLENSFLHFFMLDFLLEVTAKNGRRYLGAWLAVNGLLTFVVTMFQIPGTFFADVLVLFVFAKAVLRIRTSDLAAPAVMLFTFCTFREGYLAFVMSWMSSTLPSSTDGRLEQALATLLLDVLFVTVLQIMKKRYSCTLQQSVSSCLYLLLFPCIMIILNLRYGLRLDSRDFAQHLSSFGRNGRSAVLLTMFVAIMIVFFVIEVFCKIVRFNGQENAMAMLKNCASFQHDIDNHLLVISGLLRDRRFVQAEQYVEKLKSSCEASLVRVSTGRPVLDVLLREKLSDAARGHIEVSEDVVISEDFDMDDIDLCALFSNILDNAVAACMAETQEHRSFSLTAKMKSNFLIIEAVNTTSIDRPAAYGTGLKNVRQIVKKYQGTMETEVSGGQFRIRILLCSAVPFTNQNQPFV